MALKILKLIYNIILIIRLIIRMLYYIKSKIQLYIKYLHFNLLFNNKKENSEINLSNNNSKNGNIYISGVEVIDVLNKTSYNIIYLGKLPKYNKLVIVKTIVKKNLTNYLKRIDSTLSYDNELIILKKLSKCNNIIQLISHHNIRNETLLLLEYMDKKDLFYYIHDTKYSIKQINHILLSVCNGLSYIHKKHIIHRDIKPENIFLYINKNNVVSPKIGDFGLSKYAYNKKCYTYVGTINYIAPEIWICNPYIGMTTFKFLLNKNIKYGYDNKVDLWALGIVAYNLITKNHPYSIDKLYNINNSDSSILNLYNEVRQKKIKIKNYPTITYLIRYLLNIDSSNRFTVSECASYVSLNL